MLSSFQESDAPSVNVLLGLGGNLGDVSLCIKRAVALLSSALDDVEWSPFYRTAPHFDKPGAVVAEVPEYTNAVLAARTRLSPTALLDLTQSVENALGRERSIPCAPRTLDIDILLYGDAVVESPLLTIPHPRMHCRNFVLVPACAIAANWVHPLFRQTLGELLARCPDKEFIEALPTRQDG